MPHFIAFNTSRFTWAACATAALAALASLTSTAHAQIVNGDFEQGNTGFTSGYSYLTSGSSTAQPEGTYTVSNNPKATHNGFTTLSDSPSVPGSLFFIANGDTRPGTVVWQQNNINVAANSTIFFNMDLANVSAGSPAVLQFYLRRPSVSSSAVAFGSTFSNTVVNPTGGASDWQTFSSSFTTGAAETSIDLFVVNQTTAAGGNDFAMDDLRLSSTPLGTNVGGTAAPEPGSIALLLTAGVPVVGLVRRRKKVAATA